MQLGERKPGGGPYLPGGPAALSPAGQMRLRRGLRELAEEKPQPLISAPSPMPPAFPGAGACMPPEGGIRLTPCDEARHGQAARRFGEKPGQRPWYLPAEPEETERAG